MRIKRTSIRTKLVIAILMIYAIVSLVAINDRRVAAESELEELHRQEAAIAAENDGMQYALDNRDDPEVIRKIARDQLGMVDPGEEIYSTGN